MLPMLVDSAIRKRFQASMSREPVDTNFVFDTQLCRKAMIKYIIHAEVPFLQFVDPYLQPWIETMQPTFKVKGRQTIRSDCFKKFEDLKTELHTELQNLDSRVCLTSDIWTASQNLGYMAVTAHYIDVEFKIKKKIIWFKVLEYPHSGFAMKEEIVRCLTEWGIRDKLFTLTLDNASNNTTACEELVTNHGDELLFEGEHLHVRCSAHILNILVQDGMLVIHTAIRKLRELLKHIDSSLSRLQVFNSLANGMGLASKSGIYLDIPTRWNSTFKMLRDALKYKVVLNSYAPKYHEPPPTEEEWKKATAVCEFLKAFEELTLAVSAHRKPTSHRFLPLVLCILHALKDPAWQSTDLLMELAMSMHWKFEKYWSPAEDDLHNVAYRKRKKKEIAFSVVLVIATILDPRRKADFLSFFFERVFSDTSKIDMYVRYAIEWMRKYFTLYEQRYTRTSSVDMMTRANQASTNMGSPVLGKRKIEVDFAQYATQRRIAQAPKAEIDTYFEEPLEPDNVEDFDILAWWKSKSDKFPVLSIMVRDFLAIPLSTVSSESTFSLGGRILGERRSSLAPEMLEALVCGKDWLFMTKDLAEEGRKPFFK
jgi:hypothetical protein